MREQAKLTAERTLAEQCDQGDQGAGGMSRRKQAKPRAVKRGPFLKGLAIGGEAGPSIGGEAGPSIGGEAGPSSRPDNELDEDRLSFLSDDTKSKKARSSAGESSHLEESIKSPTCSLLKTFCDDDNDSIASENESKHPVKPTRNDRQSEELLDLEDDDPVIDDDVDDAGEDDDEEIYKCDTCNSAFLSIADFMDHRNYDCDTDIGIGEMEDSPSKFSMSGSDEENSSSELLDPDSPYTLEPGSLDSSLPYHCQFCDQAFHRLTYLKRHEQVHSDKMPFKCTFCSRLFKHKRSRDRHVKLHTGDKKYQCVQCDASFSRSDHLKIHLKTHTNGKPFRCPICNRSYTTNAALMAHTQNFHKTQIVVKGKDYNCVHCSATFTTSENLHDHLQTHFSDLPDEKAALYTIGHTNGETFPESLDPDDETKCPICEETLMSVDELQAHLDMHKDGITIPLQCHYCPLAYFPSITVLNVHMKTLHSDKLSKIHQCQYCGKDYPTLFNLTEHMSAMHEPLRTHSNSSNQHTPTSTMLSCAYCTMEFISGQALRGHIDGVHSIPNAITYDADGRLLCPRCSMGFLTEQALYEHFQNSHGNSDCQLTNDARVQCQQCTKVYPNHTMLQEHVNRNHSQALDSMKYPCPYCIKQNLFDSIEQLQLHVQVFHQSDRAPVFLCPEEDCKGHFDTADALSEHIQNDHNQENDNKDAPQSSKSSNSGKNKKDKNKDKGKHKEKRKSSSGKQTPIRTLPPTPPAELEKAVEPRPSSHPTDQSSQGAFSCPTCHNEFTNEEQLVVHVLTHYKTISAEYICKDCGKSFKKPDELQKHLFEIHAHHLYKCSLCKEVFDSKVSVQVHFAVKHSNECKLYSCMKCGVVYRSEGDLLVHVKFEHLKITQPFKCLFCNQSFASDVEFQCHLTSHSEQFRCPFCNAPYCSQETLDVHLRATHDYSDTSPIIQKSQENKETPSDKPAYSSSDSDNNPKEANDMKDEEEGCFICKICDVKFPLKVLLEKHHLKEHDIQARSASIQSQMSSVTAPTQELKKKHKYPCDTCSESFKTKYELMKHAIEHTAEFKLRSESTSPQSMSISSKQPTWHCKCYVCKQPIQMETEFLSHAQQHNEEIAGPGNTIRCVACLQILTSMVELQLHARYHTQAPPSTGVHELYPCYVCGKTFGSRTDVVPKLDGSNHPCFMCLNCIKSSLESQFSGVSSGISFVKIPTINNHRCPKCSVKFETREELDAHLATHGSGKTYQCIKCQQNFATEMEIQLHVTTHVLSEGVHLECKLCKDIFDSPAKLQCHLINHSFADKEYRCPICRAMFSCAQDIQAHAIEHGMEARRHKCSQCSQTFFFSAELQNHVLSHPSQEDLGIFRCEECRRVFSSSASLSNHARLHDNPPEMGFKCSICMEMFYSTVELQQHYFRTHSDAELGCKKKSFKCGQCDEVFPCLSNLQGHMRIHTDGRKYTCTTCNKVFSLARNLTIHMRSHSGEKPYQCPMCDKRFARKENRKVHLKSHTGIKPFMCPHCGKMFSRKCHVRDHMRTHTMTVTRGTLFQCEYCQETFTLAKNLRRHMRRLHKEQGTSQSSSASPLSSSESHMGEDETSPEMGASSESDSLGAEPIVSSSQDPQATEEMQIL